MMGRAPPRLPDATSPLHNELIAHESWERRKCAKRRWRDLHSCQALTNGLGRLIGLHPRIKHEPIRPHSTAM